MADQHGDRPGPVGPADGERQRGAEAVIAAAPDPTASGSDEAWLFGLFAFLLALSLIVHQLWWGGFNIDARHFLVVLAALAVLRRPTSVARFLAMIGAEVVVVGLDMPDVGSHTLLVLVIGATVLVHVGWTAGHDRQLPDAGALFTRIAPFLGVQLLLLYGFSGAAFHAVLALAGNAPFSALALAVYVMFLPSDTLTSLRAGVVRRAGALRWTGRARL